ncbi:serine/threonine-protein kinase meng-po isoform X2 [Chelonus insularis]|nr:serine/threonine-protein kinase meng-po isoform X2 [Chelonus insularis]XP_034945569.1 serine/threonine-protein kinase meng-po isoform X2 [Chelonus insularis]
MALKALPKAYTAITDFFREFHYGLHLSAHRNIITTYDVAFETAGFYVFSQEYAPLGDLTANVSETGLGELHTKKVARQLAAAVYHIHSRELVHRDIKLDNVLIFKSDFSRIKLCDFGETRKFNTIVRRHNEWLPYSPPEVLQVNPDDTYKAIAAHDVWQFGIVIFVCLTGCLPWQKATLEDKRYTRYLNWHSATLNIAKKPKLFQLVSSRAQRMFKRLLEPKSEKRLVNVLEVNKYIDDRWLGKLGAEKALSGGADERDELCPSMYSFHSSPEEKSQLLYTLTRYGIETNVDRSKKKDRIREWIQCSTITEGNEDEEEPMEDFKLSIESSDAEDKKLMVGKHFPEIRSRIESSSHPRELSSIRKIESSRSSKLNDYNDSRKHHKFVHGSPMKNLEKKNPFAPQVAHEIQTMAKYAIFPNGNPNLANTKTIDAIQPQDEKTIPISNLAQTKYSISNVGLNINGQVYPSTSFHDSPNSSVHEVQNTHQISLKAQDSIYSQFLPQSSQHHNRLNKKHLSASTQVNVNLDTIIATNTQLVNQSSQTIRNKNLTPIVSQSSTVDASSTNNDKKNEYEHIYTRETIPSRSEMRHSSTSGSGSRSASN